MVSAQAETVRETEEEPPMSSVTTYPAVAWVRSAYVTRSGMTTFDTTFIAHGDMDGRTRKTLKDTGSCHMPLMMGQTRPQGEEGIAAGNQYVLGDVGATGQGTAEREDRKEGPVAKHGSTILDKTPTTTNSEYGAELIIPPVTSRVLPETFATELRRILTGLSTVEAKYVHREAAPPTEISSAWSDEQWRGLIALRRTLLYEHHDFLMATQHSSAVTTLKHLACKYGVPVKTWKDGDFSFMEVLQGHQPHSQDYMPTKMDSFHKLMSTLHETVPSFTSTWTECFGDLVRYSMVCDGVDQHISWSKIATKGYTMACDRWVTQGQWSHYTGPLQRSNLLEYYEYSMPSTSMLPSSDLHEFNGTSSKWSVQDHGRSAENWIFLFSSVPAHGELLVPMLEELDNKSSIYLALSNAFALFESKNGVFGNVASEQDTRTLQQPEVAAQESIGRSSPTGSYSFLMDQLSSISTLPGWKPVKSRLSRLLSSWTIYIGLLTHTFFQMLPRAAAAAVLPDQLMGNITSASETDFSSTSEPHQQLVNLMLSYLGPFVILLTGALLAHVRFRNIDQQYQSPKRSRVIAGMTAVVSCLFSLTDNELGPIAASISVTFQMVFMAEQCFDVRNVGLYVALDIIFAGTITFLIATILAPSTTSAATSDSQMRLVIRTAISIAPGINTLMAWLLFLVLRERPRRDDGQTPDVELQPRSSVGDVGVADVSNSPS